MNCEFYVADHQLGNFPGPVDMAVFLSKQVRWNASALFLYFPTIGRAKVVGSLHGSTKSGPASGNTGSSQSGPETADRLNFGKTGGNLEEIRELSDSSVCCVF
jgi:hypothetical protein